MKKRMAFMMTMILAAGLCACGGKTNVPENSSVTETENNAPQISVTESSEGKETSVTDEYTEIIMKFGTTSSETSLVAKAFMDWGDRMEEKSGGKVRMDVYCSSVLGSSTEMVQGAQMGTVDAVVIQPGGIADMGATKMNLLCLPYLFKNYEQYYNTLLGPVGETLLQDVTDHVQGVVGFGYLPDGGRCWFTNGKAITKLEDIKGMKLRVQTYEIEKDTADALGYSATPIAFSETYSAIQTGIVDGAENALTGIDGNGFYEIAQYLVLDNHTYNIPVICISQKTWDSLNEDTRELLRDTWMETLETFYKPQLAEYEAGLLDKFKNAGMEVVEITDYDKWVEAVKPVWDKYGSGVEDLIEQVQALAE